MELQLVDADCHYYEAQDAFLRYADKSVRSFVRWVDDGSRRRLVFGDRVAAVPGNPTFDPIAKPGAFQRRLRDLEEGSVERGADDRLKFLYGDLEPLSRAYVRRDDRLAVLDDQGVERCMMFPTLGMCVEGLMHDNAAMAYKAFGAFNRWLDDDWGFAHAERIYAAPYIPMLDPALAVTELDEVLDRGARVICLRPGPAAGRSPADPVWDGVWSRVNEAGVLVVYHAAVGPSPYEDAFEQLWGRRPVTDVRYHANLKASLVGFGDRAVIDTLIALVIGNLFGRFPNIRVASIELGSTWVPYVLRSLDHAGGLIEREIDAFGVRIDEKPSDIFRRHVYVSPYPEEDVTDLVDLIGDDRVLFGSDWPHPEGMVAPRDYLSSLVDFDADSVRRIMRDNALALLSPPA